MYTTQEIAGWWLVWLYAESQQGIVPITQYLGGVRLSEATRVEAAWSLSL